LPPADRIAERRRHEHERGACGENGRLSDARIDIIFDPSFGRHIELPRRSKALGVLTVFDRGIEFWFKAAFLEEVAFETIEWRTVYPKA
jgi:hypothetical protein